MKFTLSWLKDHLETDAELATIAETLTAVGLEIEQITDRAAALAGITVAHITTAEKHPDADRLKLCMVDTGSETIQVVCGAPNARAGIKVALARPGTVIPASGDTLKAGKIRGVESQGMMCSYRELELGEDHDGIIELPENAEIGVPVAEVLGLTDPVLEIGLTPNRPDCTGVRGIARDLAASGLGTLKPLAAAAPVAGHYDSPINVHRALPTGRDEACPAFFGRHIRNVRNGESPDWLKRRLEAIGLRPISALVDITNLVTFDLGRPLHVFDADKLTGDITVRFAQPGETLAALDNRAYRLEGGMVVIADEAGPQGLGGIIGGTPTGCLSDTVNVFLECALFDPVTIAHTGRTLGIQSDARYRFERGVDPESVAWGVELATRLIVEICGGEPSHTVRAGEVPDWRRAYEFRLARLDALGGVRLAETEALRILNDLGFDVAGEGPVRRVTPPSWRPDIAGEADLVEEVLRIHGYDNIPTASLPRLSALPRPVLTPAQKRVGTLRRALAVRGLDETVTWSFTKGSWAEAFAPIPDGLRLANPISSDLDVMRPSVLINLLDAVARNENRGFADLALFEIGPEFFGVLPGDQRQVAAGLRAGATTARSWTGTRRAVDAYDAKADLIAGLTAMGAAVDNAQVNAAGAPAWYHPGRSAALQLGPKTVLGVFGEIHPRILKTLDVSGRVVGFELYPDAVPMPKRKGTARPPLNASALQAVERDFAFLLDETVAAETVVRAARSADKALIHAVTIFDLYAGKGIAPGKKSLAFSVTLQPTRQTLTDAEIEAVCQKVVAAVTKATDGQLRG